MNSLVELWEARNEQAEAAEELCEFLERITEKVPALDSCNSHGIQSMLRQLAGFHQYLTDYAILQRTEAESTLHLME